MEQQNSQPLGVNRTGIGTSPIKSSQLEQDVRQVPPTSQGDAMTAGVIRADYIQAGDTVGSIPPPPSIKGMFQAAVSTLTGSQPTLLIDKIGGRMAFERSGVRLYELLIGKVQALGGRHGTEPTALQLIELRNEELEHFHLLRRACEHLGADPTVTTPSADVNGVLSLGVVQVLSDPRTTVAQCLDGILAAELVDNDSWQMLVNLAMQGGYTDLVEPFQRARDQEINHLRKVRRWLQVLTLGSEDLAEQPVPTSQDVMSERPEASR